MSQRFTIVGIGEALFDVFSYGKFLGGAPLNVVFHVNQLGRYLPCEGVLVSRVGQDDLGGLLRKQLAHTNLSTRYVQTAPDHPTGQVIITIDQGGEPTYDIIDPVAWDTLQFTPDLADLAERTHAVCFGSLGQRHPKSRDTHDQFLKSTSHAIRLFDVNLRQHFYNATILEHSCRHATVLKTNEHELSVLCRELDIRHSTVDLQIRGLLQRFHFKLIALTRGPLGTVLFTPLEKIETKAASYTYDKRADNVGAGDACIAGLLTGLVLDWPLEKTLRVANHLGAYVASQPGATPPLTDTVINLIW